MTTVEAEGRDFTLENFHPYLSVEVQDLDSRIISVSSPEDTPDGVVTYRLDAQHDGVEFSIFVHFSPTQDAFAIESLLRSDADQHHEGGVSQFLDWWDEYEESQEEGLLIDPQLHDKKYLILSFEDEASAFYLEFVWDMIKDLLDAVPGCVKKLDEIFGPNQSTN